MSTFWIYDITQLFKTDEPNTAPVPIEHKLNRLSQCILVAWAVLFLLKYKYANEFLIIFLSFIIIHYYINTTDKNTMMRENYIPPSTCYSTDLSITGPNVPNVTYFDKDIYAIEMVNNNSTQLDSFSNTYARTIPLKDWKQIPNQQDLRIQTPGMDRLYNQEVPAFFDKDYYSTNFALQNQKGPASMKTAIPPVIIAPAMASDYWSEKYSVPQNINRSTNQELYLSGYLGNSKCNDTSNLQISSGDHSCNINVTLKEPQNGCQIVGTNMNNFYPVQATPVQENFVPSARGVGGGVGAPEPWNQYNASYTYQPNSTPAAYNTTTQRNKPIWINEQGTEGDIINTGIYNPQQMLEHNIPSNFPSGLCSKDDTFNEYNRNLFTNIIEPGMYSRNEVIEPINANMGISDTLQFEPVARTVDANGNTTFTIQDPRVIRPRPPLVQVVQPTNSNVYDPRSFGYGTSYRSYIDEMSGQPRFYYDDVEAIRRPNYIGRSNVDCFKWADSYQTIAEPNTPENFNSMSSHRALAQSQFLNSNLTQREELEQRYMRKFNSEVAWQRRLAPIRRDGRAGTMSGM
jgi:hypothetical protein